MTSKIKLIRTIYLYLAVAVSLLFTAIGTGSLVNTALKAYVFPAAEKSFGMCGSQPPAYGVSQPEQLKAVATPDQKAQLDALLQDYQNWKENNTGEKCIQAQRQSAYVDAITMILVALPILLIHWRIIKKEKNKENE